jgi:hypothetical protein
MRKRGAGVRKKERSTVTSDDKLRFQETDEIAARLKRDTEVRLRASQTAIDATKRTLKRTPP